ncbi:MAG: alpha-amylase family glycosyl hydrolase [Oscillospiraceae bacterium]
MMSWWLNKGIDGFRMDVISLISKPDPIPRDTGSDLSPYCINGPQVHTYLKEMRQKVAGKVRYYDGRRMSGHYGAGGPKIRGNRLRRAELWCFSLSIPV